MSSAKSALESDTRVSYFVLYFSFALQWENILYDIHDGFVQSKMS